jgi:hypothetical protein
MDDLLKQIRQEREAYAARFGFDLRAIHRDLKQREATHRDRVVRRSPRRILATTDSETQRGP